MTQLLINKVCRKCGKEIFDVNSKRNFHAECYIQHLNELNRERYRRTHGVLEYTKTCLNCGVILIKKRSSKQFCSEKCWHRYRNVGIITCKICCKKITEKNRRYYCSSKCQKFGYHKNILEKLGYNVGVKLANSMS